MKDDFFRTGVSKGIKKSEQIVDRENGIIYGFAVASQGLANDARGEVDADELFNIAELGNKTKIGVKSRYGHPSMSGTAFGTFLGRVKNFVVDNGVVRGDLFLDKTAYETPNGDLATYVMDLAESDPAAFGSSMVAPWDPEFKIKKDGTKETDEKGNALPPLIRFTKMRSVDIVDDPALNKSLFNNSFYSPDVQLSAEVAAFLDKFTQYPDAVDKAMDFLSRYSSNRGAKEKEMTGDHRTLSHCKTYGGHYLDNLVHLNEDENNNNNEQKEDVNMDFKELTLDALKSGRVDLFDAILSEGKTAGINEGIKTGVTQERERAFSIIEEANGFKDVGALALESVKEGYSKEAALDKFKTKKIQDLETAAPASAGPGIDPEKNETFDNLPIEERLTKEWEADKDLQQEFKRVQTYIAFKIAEGEGRVKILGTGLKKQ